MLCFDGLSVGARHTMARLNVGHRSIALDVVADRISHALGQLLHAAGGQFRVPGGEAVERSKESIGGDVEILIEKDASEEGAKERVLESTAESRRVEYVVGRTGSRFTVHLAGPSAAADCAA